MNQKSLNILSTELFLNHLKINRKYFPQENVSIYLKTGTLNLELNGKKYTLNSSSIFFIYKGSVYSILSYSDLELYILEADPKTNADLLFGFSKYEAYQTQQHLEKSFQLEDSAFNVIWQHVKTIDYYWQKELEDGFQDRIIRNLYTALIYMMVEVVFIKKKKTNAFDDRKEKITIQFMQAVESDFKQFRTLDHYASQLNLSAKYVSNCIRETTAANPRDIIAKTTADFAKKQLLQTPLTIEEISDSLNFSDVYSFGKFFKKHSGYSPGKFRKLLQ